MFRLVLVCMEIWKTGDAISNRRHFDQSAVPLVPPTPSKELIRVRGFGGAMRVPLHFASGTRLHRQAARYTRVGGHPSILQCRKAR